MEGLSLEVWFSQPTEVSVFLESSVISGEEEQFLETTLFALYASRQIANLRGDGKSLAYLLGTIQNTRALQWTTERLNEVKFSSPEGRGGRKGFTCELRPGKRSLFKMQAHGFGMMGRGVGYYALTSTLALLHWLLERRRDDTMYQGALAATAEKVGAAGMHGLISATSQARVAMGAAGDAWREATEVASHLDTAEPGADVLAACHANGINYGQLVADASRRLAETAAQLERDGVPIVALGAIAPRFCRAAVVDAAHLTNDRLERAIAAAEAADATRDDALIRTAYEHYDFALAETIDENGLAPVVLALADLLFERQSGEAIG